MQGHRKSFGANVFSKSEKRAVLAQVVDGRTNSFVDLDLFDAGITLDIEDAVTLEQVIVEFLGSANIKDRVGFPVKLLNFQQAQTGGRLLGEVAGAITPTMFEAELIRELGQDPGGIGIVIPDFKRLRVIRKARRIFDIVNVVPESLQPDDIMNVLPDNPGNRHRAHEPHDDDFLAPHVLPNEEAP